MNDYSNEISDLNRTILNPRDSYEVLAGFETLLENLVYRIYDLFGRNALLSMLYTIGAGHGNEVANSILEEKNLSKIDDPIEAIKFLLEKNMDFFSVQVKSFTVEEYDEKLNKMTLEIENSCFYRESLNRRKLLEIGGPLCRINKGFIETSWTKLTGLRCEIDFHANDETSGHCNETLTIYIPKENQMTN